MKIFTIVCLGLSLLATSGARAAEEGINGLDRRIVLAAGLYRSNNLDTSKTATELMLGYSFPVQQMSEIRLAWAGLYRFGDAGGGAYFQTGSLTAAWNQFFSLGKPAPFVGGEIGYGFADRPDANSLSGILVGANAGIRCRAISWANVELSARYGFLTAAYPGGNPSVFGIRLAFLF